MNNIINAVVVKNYEEARQEARDLDNRITDMDDDELKEFVAKHPLAGVPFSMKDAFEVEGKVITCGIWNRRNTVCTRTAEVVTRFVCSLFNIFGYRMREAGGILLAITNVPEVCMWVETINSIYGRTNNPYDAR